MAPAHSSRNAASTLENDGNALTTQCTSKVSNTFVCTARRNVSNAYYEEKISRLENYIKNTNVEMKELKKYSMSRRTELENKVVTLEAENMGSRLRISELEHQNFVLQQKLGALEDHQQDVSFQFHELEIELTQHQENIKVEDVDSYADVLADKTATPPRSKEMEYAMEQMDRLEALQKKCLDS